MKALSAKRLICTWLLLGGFLLCGVHCALGVTAPESRGAHSCCTDVPTDSDPQTALCCEGWMAPLSEGTLVLGPAGSMPLMEPAWHDGVDILPVLVIASVLPDIPASPPGVVSFSELLLEASCPAHAPPSLA